MIGTSWWEYLFIRLCIIFLHYIVPLTSVCYILLFLIDPFPIRVPVILEVWAFAETLFVLLYLPQYHFLQHKATHPALPSRRERRTLFHRCDETVQDPEHYLTKWFLDAPSSEIRRENVKEFYCWAFLNKPSFGILDDDELEEYAAKTEKALGRNLPPGRGNATSLRLTLDRVKMLHRPLLWYLCVFVVDSITCIYLLCRSFTFHRLALRRYFTVFPFRPFTLLTKHQTPANTLTYWHRQHTSKEHLPVLFIHGIGIGLYPYVNFLSHINSKDDEQNGDDQIGIIAIEIMPISFRITHPALERKQMCEEILSILLKHGWEKVILVSHSYGSVIATHLLKDDTTSGFIGPTLFIDPVSFLLHLPDVAYNFTCRQPTRANEHQLYYFASTDMFVAHTLSRRFFWSENILWKNEIQQRPVTVVLCGKDIIVDTETVGRYLSGTTLGEEHWKHQQWRGQGLDILWFDDLDHAQVFDSKKDYGRLVEVVRAYSVKKPPGQDDNK